MKRILKAHLNILLCLALLLPVLLCGSVFPAYARQETPCTLKIDYIHEEVAISGARFHLYRIADLDEQYLPIYTGSFSDLRLELKELPNSILDLYNRTQSGNLQPEKTLTTDKAGQASAQGIRAGIFLLVGEPVKQGRFTYHVDHQILRLPALSAQNGQWENALTVHPKSSKLSEGLQLIGVKTVKRWEDKGYESDRPNAISVSLLRNGKVVSTVTLSQANNWSYTWTNLLPNAQWSVREAVPEGYVAELEKDENTFTLTNYHKDIDQTGQIWWPVVLVLCMGLVLIMAGVVLRRSGRHDA